MTNYVAWSQIEAECEGYRAGFVATFRKYEGLETDERDGRGAIVKVTVESFARHTGIPPATFRAWVRNANATTSVTIGPSTKQRAGWETRRLSPEERAELVDELINDDPHVADHIENVIATDPASTARVNQKAAQMRPTPPRHEPQR